MARDIRRDEFEGRNRQLPADLDQSASYSGSAQARKDLSNTPLGSPPQCVDVRSVYDTRPINGFDFNIQTSGGADPTPDLLQFQVPEGYVCVLRSFDIWIENPIPAIAKSGAAWTLILNGGDVPYNGPVSFGSAVDDETVFLIADEFNMVGLRITVFTGGELTTIYARFYGNFLLKTAVPAPWQIGNPVNAPGCGQPVTRPRVPTELQPERPRVSAPAPAPAPAPVIGMVNLVSSRRGTGSQVVAVRDAARATLPGGFRPFSKQEYTQHAALITNYIAANRKFAPNLQALVK